jgi:hypothetical protein
MKTKLGWGLHGWSEERGEKKRGKREREKIKCHKMFGDRKG